MAVAAVEMRYRTNSKGQTYPQWYDENGKMVGCGCDEAKAVTVEKYNMKPCHHRREYNAALEAILTVDLEPHVEDDLRSYQGCDFCGRNHKSWNCPF